MEKQTNFNHKNMKLHEAREKQIDICVTALKYLKVTLFSSMNVKFGDSWLVHTRQTTSTKQIILRFTVARAARDVTN